MEKIGPNFFLPFLLTFRSCNSPTSISSCIDRTTGACLSPPRSWLCSWELGSSTWGSMRCQHPHLDTGRKIHSEHASFSLFGVPGCRGSGHSAWCPPPSAAGRAGCQRRSLQRDPACEQKSQLPRARGRTSCLCWPSITDPKRGALLLRRLPRTQAGVCLFNLVKAWTNKGFFKQKLCRSRNRRFSHEV